MPTKKWIDKKKALNFALVHRSHEDAHYYDDDVSGSVFMSISKDNKKKHLQDQPGHTRIETKNELEDNLAESDKMRSNEGEAAMYGITYDDSEYDYMQHLRTIGSGGDGVFISKTAEEDDTAKKEFKLKEILPNEMLPTEQGEYDYQRQQSIPDEISGFKPDLNPDLREALTALDDEAYLDDSKDVDDIDVFASLLNGKKHKDLSLREYNELALKDEGQEQWDLDQYDEYGDVDAGDDDFSWEKDFNHFKKANMSGKIKNDWDTDDEFESDEDEDEVVNREETRDTIGELPSIDNKKKVKSKKARRKKGATTDTSSYSMSSSALCRTEQLSIIDDRFDVMKKKYEQDEVEAEEEEEPEPFDFKNERSDFASLIDDFLDNYEQKGKKIVRKDEESERIREAADTVSKSKLAERRRKEKGRALNGATSLKGLTKGINGLNI
ncbi:DEKNAAC102145 [Brettanomyces naardenensis]|uniref:DEKNAAC102145 n=1 Tax=Brettanomyces naardenensis TaxID=13370 RepID=A0A448YJX6_BRENA|nr:DEKNAAC102145 [Brettanomyces naardenensis]